VSIPHSWSAVGSCHRACRCSAFARSTRNVPLNHARSSGHFPAGPKACRLKNLFTASTLAVLAGWHVGFVREHVQVRTRNEALLQSLHRRGFLDEAAARHVDAKTLAAQGLQHIGIHHPLAGRASDFVEVPAPTDEALQTVLHKIITRTMKLLTRRGVLVEEEGSTYMADSDADSDEARVLRPLQAAAWPCRPRRASGPAPRQAQTVHWTV